MSTPVDRIEQALKQRYNVSQLPEQLAAAVSSARDGQPALLIGLMEGREMYRWAAEARAAVGELVEVPSPSEGSLSDLTIAQLRVLAEERGVEIPIGPKAAIVAALEAEPEDEGSTEETEEDPVEPTT